MSVLSNAVKNLEICRLCLNLTVVKIDIFTDDFSTMIEILTSLKIKPDDHLPKVSCLKCAREVKSAILIRRRIIQSYMALISTVKKPSNTKPGPILRNLLENTNASENLKDEDAENLKNDSVASDSDNDKDDDKKRVEATSALQNLKVENEVKSETPKGIVENSFLKRLEPIIEVQTESPLSTSQEEKIQRLKLETNTKFIEKLKFLETKKRIHAMKIMNKNDQLNVVKWLEKKKINKGKLVGKLPPPKPRNKEPKPLHCNHCKIKFNNKITYKNHMTRHKHKTCPTCDKQIRSTYLKKHMLLHSSEPVICEMCGSTCKNPSSLRMHHFYYHKNPTCSVCEDCGRSFRTKTKLLYHQRKDHTKERNFKCETCGKTFFLKMYLTKHINMKHMKLRPHICEYCGKGFSGKHALRTHVRQHTNEAPYACNLCGERFRQRVSLRGHLKSRHSIEEENKVFCDACGKGFASHVALDVHSRLHTEMKCPYCSDTFAEKEYMDQHITTAHAHAQENVVDDGGFRWLSL